MHEIEFAVTGVGSFPVQMLQNDRCYPATESDAHEIYHDDIRTIRLRSMRRDVEWLPSTEKWAEHGWTIEVSIIARAVIR